MRNATGLIVSGINGDWFGTSDTAPDDVLSTIRAREYTVGADEDGYEDSQGRTYERDAVTGEWVVA